MDYTPSLFVIQVLMEVASLRPMGVVPLTTTTAFDRSLIYKQCIKAIGVPDLMNLFHTMLVQSTAPCNIKRQMWEEFHSCI